MRRSFLARDEKNIFRDPATYLVNFRRAGFLKLKGDSREIDISPGNCKAVVKAHPGLETTKGNAGELEIHSVYLRFQAISCIRSVKRGSPGNGETKKTSCIFLQAGILPIKRGFPGK